jgi:hypothetical protein
MEEPEVGMMRTTTFLHAEANAWSRAAFEPKPVGV